MIWAVLAAMTAFAVAVLALPLRRARKVVARAAYDLAVYRDQLVELERDAARGLVDPAEAQAARAEIGRRMLAAAGTAEAADPAPAAGLRPMALAFAVAAPLAALSLYLASGSPRLPDRPYASRLDGGEESGEARIARLVGELQRRATERPDDPEIWQRIAVGLGALGRFDESVAAWRRVMRLTNDAAAFAGPFAEALVYEAQGSVTAEARALFERARAADPNDFRARFYLGLAKQQGGDPRAALQEWADMIALAPSDAPWLAMVRARFEATAVDAGIDPASIQPSKRRGRRRQHNARHRRPRRRRRRKRGGHRRLAAGGTRPRDPHDGGKPRGTARKPARRSRRLAAARPRLAGDRRDGARPRSASRAR